jgi:RNA polymerase sigma-70 factor, ECF subfamily
LVQETYLKLCAENSRLLREFKSQHPDAIYGYLKVLTANVAHDYLKASHAVKRGSGQTAESMELAELTAPETGNTCSANEATVERSVLLQEIDAHLVRSVSPAELPRSRLIFWLYYRVGLSASAIAGYPRIGLTTKGVESVLLRLTRVLKAALAPRPETKKGRHEGLSNDEKGLGQSESF